MHKCVNFTNKTPSNLSARTYLAMNLTDDNGTAVRKIGTIFLFIFARIIYISAYITFALIA